MPQQLTYKCSRNGFGPARFRFDQHQAGRPTGLTIHQSGTTYWIGGRFHHLPRFGSFKQAARVAATILKESTR